MPPITLRSQYGYVLVEDVAAVDLNLPAVSLTGEGSLAAELNVTNAVINLPAVSMLGVGTLTASLDVTAYVPPGPPGSPLAWYDYALTASLFQDAARTTPTTANGQIVQGVADQSGNGRHQENASGVGTREAAGFAAPVAANAGLLCPSMAFTAGHTIFVIADAATGSGGFLTDTRDSPTNYIYRSAPYANVGGYFVGDAAYFTGLAGHRCFAMRTGTGLKPSIWRAGTKYAEDATTLGTVADLARVWSIGQLSVSPWNEPAATTYKGMLLYSGALSDGDMAAVSTWAATRWGL